MCSRPSGEFRYILHLMDHFSKFHMVQPIKRKTVEEVNSVLTGMFGVIGLPAILQTDNGSEFSQLSKIFENWPGAGDVQIIHGRPAHPQSQGLVERGHRLVQDRLAVLESEWLRNTDCPFPWHERLPIIQYQINTAHTSTTGQMPYKVIFGREPKTSPLFGRSGHITENSESGDSFSTAFDEASDQEIETIPESSSAECSVGVKEKVAAECTPETIDNLGDHSDEPSEENDPVVLVEEPSETETEKLFRKGISNIESGLKCGCLRKGPFKLKSTSLLTDVRETGKFLEEQRPFLKAFLLDICNKKICSWRANEYNLNKSTTNEMLMLSGLTVPIDDVACKIKMFIDSQLPGIVSGQYKDCVLFPEILIRLLTMRWNINKMEAEYILRDGTRLQC